MRTVVAGCVAVLAACASSALVRPAARPSPPAAAPPAPTYSQPEGPAAAERLTADTPRTTVEGASFIAPAGWSVDAEYGIPVVHHGGDMIGFHSDMLWLPELGVGAVVLTNGDPGWLPDLFRRKLLEVLFDGRPEAYARMAAGAKAFFAQLEADRKLLTVPADAAEVQKLARRYANDALGEIAVDVAGGATTFDFRRVAKRDGEPPEPRRNRLVRHHRAGHDRRRVRGGRWGEAHARHP